MTISVNISDTYTNESGVKNPVTIEALLHDIRTKFTNHVSRAEQENTLNIYHDTIKHISEILEANNIEVSENIKNFLENNLNDKVIKFYSDEMNQTQNISYNTNKAQNLTKSQETKELLIESFNAMIEAIKCDYKNNDYRNRNLPKNFNKYIGIGVIYFGANEEMRALRDEDLKEIKGLTPDEADFFNSLDSNELMKRSDKFLKKIEERLGVKVLYQVNHNDEKTQHIQFMYSSYNFKTHKGFNSNLKKFDLKKLGIELQDMIAEEFKDMKIPKFKNKDFSIKRGKHNTKSIENLSMSQMQQEKIREQGEIIKILEQRVKSLENEFKATKKAADEYANEKSKEIEDLEEKYNSKSLEFEELSFLFKTAFNELKEVKKEVKSIAKDLNIDSLETKSILDILDEIRANILEISKETLIMSKNLKNDTLKYENLKNDYEVISIKLNATKEAISFTEENILKIFENNSSWTGLNKNSFITDLFENFNNVLALANEKKLSIENKKLSEYIEKSSKLKDIDKLAQKQQEQDNKKDITNKLIEDNAQLRQDKALLKQEFQKVVETSARKEKTILRLKELQKSTRLKFDKKFRESKRAEKILDQRKRAKSIKTKIQEKEKNNSVIDFEDSNSNNIDR